MENEGSLRGAGGTSEDDAIVVLDDAGDDCNDSSIINSNSRKNSIRKNNGNNMESDNVIMIDDDDDCVVEEVVLDQHPSLRQSQIPQMDSDSVTSMARRKRPIDQSSVKEYNEDLDREFEKNDINIICNKKLFVEADVQVDVSLSLKGGQPNTTPIYTEGSSKNDDDVYVDDVTTIRNHRRKELNRIGCRLDPSKSPIKLFATKQDEELRQRLHLVATGDSSRSCSSGNKNQHTQDEHWSFNHCWTFREMFGLDRMWGAINGRGIDFVVIGTYLLDLGFLMNEIPELLDVPLVVIIYHHKDPSITGAEQKWRDHISRNRRNEKNATLVLLERNPRADPDSSTNPLPVRMDYGCHHSKFVLVRYRSRRLRIIIHSSNLGDEDVHLKCQGAYIQDFLPKTDDQLSSFVTSDFEEALVQFFESYRFMDTHIWSSSRHDHSGTASSAIEATTLVAHLQTYDFSTAKAVLVPSIPGYHSTLWRKRFNSHLHGQSAVLGYLKVQQAISEFGTREMSSNTDSSTPTYGIRSRMDGPFQNDGSDAKHISKPMIVCQFSSIGSLSQPYLDKVATAWAGGTVSGSTDRANNSNASEGKNPYLHSARSKRTKIDTASTTHRLTHQNMKFVWPTVNEIIMSVEGPGGGHSVPGRTKCVGKEFLQPLYHKWDGRDKSSSSSANSRDDVYQKGRHVPHIKTYYEIDKDTKEDSMKWFVLSSHNFSKAAWGEIQNRRDRGEVLMIQHWELGVFLSPRILGVDTMGPECDDCLKNNKTNNSRSSSRSSFVLNKDSGSSANDGHSSKLGVLASYTQTLHDTQCRRRAVIPLPYQFRPIPYGPSDQPWVVDLLGEG